MGGAAAHPRGSGVETTRDFETFLELSSRFLIDRFRSDAGAESTTGGRDNSSPTKSPQDLINSAV